MRVVFCSSFKKNANVLSTLFLCLRHLCVSEPAAALHRSASRALAHIVPAVFHTLVPWTLQCSRNGSCDWAASGLPVLPGLWSYPLQRSCWWRCFTSKASRNKCSKQYFFGLPINRETRASEGCISSLVFKHLHLETLAKAMPEDVYVPSHSTAHPWFIPSHVKSLHWKDKKNLR